MQTIRVITALVLLVGVTLAPFAGGQDEESETPAVTMWDVATTDGSMRDIIDWSVARFIEETGTPFEAVHIQNDPYKTKIKVAMGGGTPPDIFHSWGGGSLKAYIDAGTVESIDDSVISRLREVFMDAAFDPVTFDGVTYGVPYSSLTGVFFWYRADIFDEVGVEAPETWDELLGVVDQLNGAGIIPIALSNKSKWPSSMYYMYIVDRIAGEELFLDALYRRNGVTFEDPRFVRAAELVQDLVRADAFPQGFNAMEYDTGQGRQMLYNGDVAMTLMGQWHYATHRAESPETVDHLDFFVFPALGEGTGDSTNLIGSPGQDYFSITTMSDNQEAALQFLTEYVMSDEWIRQMLDIGRIPPVHGVSDMVEDPILRRTAAAFERANHVQVYWDQFLPPEVAEAHKDLVQALFALAVTPEEFAAGHEEAMLEYLAAAE